MEQENLKNINGLQEIQNFEKIIYNNLYFINLIYK
jgi:hypothetical protein